MEVQELLCLWEKTASGKLTREEYAIHLPVEDAAKLQALAEMYPRRPITNIITDLLSAALNDVESSLPYVRGENVVARDEQGDPMYEDVGPTPRYLTLIKKHMNDYRLTQEDTH